MSLTRWLLLASLLLWGASLLAPAVHVSGGPTLSGFDMLADGAGAWRDRVFSWYANPVFLVAVALCWFGRTRPAGAAAAAAMLLGLSSLFAGVAAESAGRSVPPFTFAIGFYGWLAALSVPTGVALWSIYKESK